MGPASLLSSFWLGISGVVVFLGFLSAASPQAAPEQSDPKVKRATINPEKGSRIDVRLPDLHPAPLQVDVNMVVVNVTVTDPYDRIVTGLDQSNFEVFDEKVVQEIASFSTEDAPISVGLVFDSSGSMGDKIQKSKEIGRAHV